MFAVKQYITAALLLTLAMSLVGCQLDTDNTNSNPTQNSNSDALEKYEAKLSPGTVRLEFTDPEYLFNEVGSKTYVTNPGHFQIGYPKGWDITIEPPLYTVNHPSSDDEPVVIESNIDNIEEHMTDLQNDNQGVLHGTIDGYEGYVYQLDMKNGKHANVIVIPEWQLTMTVPVNKAYEVSSPYLEISESLQLFE